MQRIRLIGLLPVVMFVFSAFVASGTASATKGPLWSVNLKHLLPGETRLLLAKAISNQILSATNATITCEKLTLPEAEHMQIIGGPAGLPGTSNEVIEYSGCKSAGTALGSPCEVQNPIKTNAVVNTLGYSRSERMGPVLVLFEPEGANGSNSRVFVTIKFTGTGCLFPGGLPVLGRIIGEAYENGKPVEVQLTGKVTELVHGGELRFVKPGPKTIWIEKHGVMTTEKTRFEAGTLSNVSLEGTSAILVDENGVPVMWGIYT